MLRLPPSGLAAVAPAYCPRRALCRPPTIPRRPGRSFAAARRRGKVRHPQPCRRMRGRAVLSPHLGRVRRARVISRPRRRGTAHKRSRVRRAGQRQRRLVRVDAPELFFEGNAPAGRQRAALLRPLPSGQDNDLLARRGFLSGGPKRKEACCRALFAGSKKAGSRDNHLGRHVLHGVSLITSRTQNAIGGWREGGALMK